MFFIVIHDIVKTSVYDFTLLSKEYGKQLHDEGIGSTLR
jgi:hypothetical protein